jgi:hypothetical protein
MNLRIGLPFAHGRSLNPFRIFHRNEYFLATFLTPASMVASQTGSQGINGSRAIASAAILPLTLIGIFLKAIS